MRSPILVLLGTMSFFATCTTKKQESQETNPPTETSSQTCYRHINNRDTVTLNATYANDSVTGMLVYNFFEKDKNRGTIQGKLKDDLLIADYSFMSEGVESVRQVAFKKNGETLTEGSGDIEEKDGKTIFKNLNSLTFTNSVILRQVACEK